jgi:hypothetical protein
LVADTTNITEVGSINVEDKERGELAFRKILEALVTLYLVREPKLNLRV